MIEEKPIMVIYDNDIWNKKIKEGKILQRIFSRCKLDEKTGCVEWLGWCSFRYGRIGIRDKNKYKDKVKKLYIHKYVYEQLIGKVQLGLQLDHLCRNRRCCNVYHLEIVTCRENILRGIGLCAVNAQKTHCLNGHVLSGENLYMYPNRIKRMCRICQRERVRDNQRKYREKYGSYYGRW